VSDIYTLTVTHHLLVLEHDAELFVRIRELLEIERAGEHEALVPLLALVLRLVSVGLRTLDCRLIRWAAERPVGEGRLGGAREQERRAQRLAVCALEHPICQIPADLI